MSPWARSRKLSTTAHRGQRRIAEMRATNYTIGRPVLTKNFFFDPSYWSMSLQCLHSQELLVVSGTKGWSGPPGNRNNLPHGLLQPESKVEWRRVGQAG